MVPRALLALALLSATPALAQQVPPVDATTMLVARLEESIAQGDTAGVLDLALSPDTPGIRQFADIASPPPLRFIIKERDRTAQPPGERLLLEVLAEFDSEAAINTWRVDVVPDPADPDRRRIAGLERLAVVTGLHKLALHPTKQFEVRKLSMKAIDLTLEMESGSAFVAETEEGPTAVVLIGRGRMLFTPSDPAERTQVRIFSGDDALRSEFDAAFVRLPPDTFPRLFGAALLPAPVVPGQLRRAEAVFEQFVGQTYQLDLTDLSRERWSLVPAAGDLVVEVRTRRHGDLTYARSSKDAEDISLFDRRRRRNISVYSSPPKLAARGRFYNEDELVEYDVLHYDIEAAFTPERFWVDGNATIRLRVQAHALSSLNLRLAEPLVVRSIASPGLGRLLHLRVVGQNSVVVNLPTSLPRGTVLTLQVAYGGRLPPQTIDREVLTVQGQDLVPEQIYIPVEPQFIYSNRSYWYPQAMVTDYATAQLRMAVPQEYGIIATGTRVPADALPQTGGAAPGRRQMAVFRVEEPARYLSCVISRFTFMGERDIAIPLSGGGDAGPPPSLVETGPPGGPSGPPAALRDPAEGVTLSVYANPRLAGAARHLVERASDIFSYYARLLGDAPYPTFDLALTENELPGGHSPAYFAILNEPHPLTQRVWRNDPVAFDGYASFFLAHEIAHQWWGQAVGWKNYREQWLSEGFAQYFALLYAEEHRGAAVVTPVLRQMRRWAIEQSPQGPVYLGYRLGHIRGDSRVFRALVYNKGAMVLHMLRRLVGDDVFFDGLREYYSEWKFRKAGTDDFREVMESVSGQSLDAFFDGWIYGSAIPSLSFSSVVTGGQAMVRFEHRTAVVPTPVTVTILYADGRSEDVIVRVTQPVVEQTLELTGRVRSIVANRDHGSLAVIRE